VGFLRGAGLLSRLGIMQGAGRGAQAARGITAGAISDFFFQEADEANLSRAWRDAGLPENVLTDFLATDPEDNAALNRLRRAVEGGVVGGALEGLIATVRAARAGLAVRRAQEAPAAGAAREAAPEPRTLNEAAGVAPNAERDNILTPDTSRPLVEMRLAEAIEATEFADSTVVAAQIRYASQAAERPGPNFYINWARIRTSDDVMAVMRDMAEALRPQIDEARRGVQTNEETVRLAQMMGMTVDQLLSRRVGEAWNAETITAARMLYTSSAETMMRAAEAATAPGAGLLEKAAFRRMTALHAAIQAQVFGARAESGRATQAWAIPAGSLRQQVRHLEELMAEPGMMRNTEEMARRVALLARAVPPDDLPRAIGDMARNGWAARTFEAIQDAWINALLSSPSTHAANIAGNTLNAFLAIAERGVASRVGALRSAAPGEGVMPGEAAAMMYGLTTGFRDALRLMAMTWRDGGVELADALGKAELRREPAISSQAFGLRTMDVDLRAPVQTFQRALSDPQAGLGAAVDFIGHSIVRAPGRAMGAEDAFFKSYNYRMELHGASLREAYRSLAARNETVTPEALGREMANFVRNPPEHVRIAAADFALYNTFNREAGPIARGLMALVNTQSAAWNLAARTQMTFIRTPANIFSFYFERSPLAPLVSQWRADVAAGGARRDLALARVATGAMMGLFAIDLAERGLLTGGGPDDANERSFMARQGVQPYSVRIGDTWVGINRLDPFGALLGSAADLHDLTRRADIEPHEVNEVSEVWGAITLSFARMFTDRTFFTGPVRLAEAVGGRNNASMETWLGGMAASFLAPGAVATYERATDPVTRDAMGIQQMIEARIAGLSQNIIPRRNVWGDMERPGMRTVMGSETAADVVNAVTPARLSPARESPIDAELQRLNYGISPIGRTVTFNGVEVNMREFPGALDRYRQLAGNGLRLSLYGDRGFRDALNDMVEGRGPLAEQYRNAPDFGRGSKSSIIAGIRDVYRNAARDRVLEEYHDLAEFVASRGGAAGPRNVRPAQVPGTTNRFIVAPIRNAQRGTSDADPYDGPERHRPPAMEMR
jgi:hypothetical protein